MGSIIAILLFSLSLIVCLLLNFSVVYALIIGYIIFISYGLIKGYSLKVLIKKSFEGIMTVKNILLVFILIGMITALWRASGTIAFIVYIGSKLISPSILIFLTFLFCAVLSVLIGTSLGTAATMGVICASIGKAMGINPYYVGGAVLSGIYFGDRCSPMSTSALLITELTKTNLYTNIKLMIKTSVLGAIACNQSLGTILTNELCGELVEKQKMAIILENTVILLVGLIPWNIAMDVPLKTIGVGFMSGLFAFYLYFLPLWNLFLDFIKERKYKIKI